MFSNYLNVSLDPYLGDFTAGVQTVTFHPGEFTSSFSVVVADDAIIEDTESFSLQLFGASFGSIDGTGSIATANIIDNDGETDL